MAVVMLSALCGCTDSKTEITASDSQLSEAVGTYTQITQEKAKQIIDSEDNIIILDVRRQDEYDSGHIPNALLIPNETITDTPPEELSDLNQKILIYCRSGNRSKQAAQKLADIGYTNVFEFGGINTWQYEIVTADDSEEAAAAEQKYPALLTSTEDIDLHAADGQGLQFSFSYNNEAYTACFSGKKWTVYDSYKIRNNADMIIICQALIDVHPVKSADLTGYRTAEDMAYEWQQHNTAYTLLPADSQWKSSTKDVDLDPADQGKSLYELFADRVDFGS